MGTLCLRFLNASSAFFDDTEGIVFVSSLRGFAIQEQFLIDFCSREKGQGRIYAFFEVGVGQSSMASVL